MPKGAKLTQQDLLFCDFLMEGRSASSAYKAAGFNATKPGAIRACAARKLASANIEAELEKRRLKVAERNEVTLDELVQNLRREAAPRSGTSGASRVAATMGLAKLTGFLKEKIELTGKQGGPIRTVALPTKAADVAAWVKEFGGGKLTKERT